MIPALSAELLETIGPLLAGLLFLMILGKALASETRVYSSALIAVVVHPQAETLIMVGLLHLLVKFLDIIRK